VTKNHTSLQESARLNATFYAKFQGDVLKDEVVDEIEKDVKHDLLESDVGGLSRASEALGLSGKTPLVAN
jgi:hypothetical protein